MKPSAADTAAPERTVRSRVFWLPSGWLTVTRKLWPSAGAWSRVTFGGTEVPVWVIVKAALVAVGVEGIGDDPQIAAILNEADDRAAQRVLDAIGFVGTGREHRTALAVFRSWGGMMKATAREWVDRKTLTRTQARAILIETLVPLVDQVMSGTV